MTQTTNSNLPTQVAVEPVNGDAILADATAIVAVSTALVIDSDDMYQIAADELRDIKAKTKSLDERRQGMVGGLNAVVKQINDLFRPAIDRLKAGEEALKRAMITYQNDQEAKRREAQRAADAIAQAERKKLQDEAVAIEAQAAQSGDVALLEKSTALREEINYVAAATAAVAAPAVKGLSTSRPWKCRIPETAEYKMAMLRHIAQHPEFLHLVDINQSACNALAKALKESLSIPGLTAYQDAVISSRS